LTVPRLLSWFKTLSRREFKKTPYAYVSWGRQSRRRYSHRSLCVRGPRRDLRCAPGRARMTTQQPKTYSQRRLTPRCSREDITALTRNLAGHPESNWSPANHMYLKALSRRSWIGCIGIPRRRRSGTAIWRRVIEIAKTIIDALIPVHEKAYLFAAGHDKLPAGLGSSASPSVRGVRYTVPLIAGGRRAVARCDAAESAAPGTETFARRDEFAASGHTPFFVRPLRHRERRTPLAGGDGHNNARWRDARSIESLDAFRSRLACVRGRGDRASSALFLAGRVRSRSRARASGPDPVTSSPAHLSLGVEGPGGRRLLMVSVCQRGWCRVATCVAKIGQA